MPLAQAKKAPTVTREAVIAAFYPWIAAATHNSIFEKIKSNKPALVLIDDALEQVVELRVASYDHWWALNNWRYTHLRETDRRIARECVRVFIADIQLGKVKL